MKKTYLNPAVGFPNMATEFYQGNELAETVAVSQIDCTMSTLVEFVRGCSQ